MPKAPHFLQITAKQQYCPFFTVFLTINTRITFRLIDQQEDANDRENIVKSLRIAKHLRCFARPMTDGYKGRGLTTFVLHKKLKERRYFLNDSTIAVIQSATKRCALEK